MNINQIPYGYLECTDETFPKISKINDTMFHFLDVDKEDAVWNDFFKENIFFMIPFQEHEYFRKQLEIVRQDKHTICFQHRIVSKSHLEKSYVSVLKYVKKEKASPFYSLLSISLETNKLHAFPTSKSYYNALTEAYDLIFIADSGKSTVSGLYQKGTPKKGSPFYLTMTLSSAKTFFVDNYVIEEDRKRISDYLDQAIELSCNGDSINATLSPAAVHVQTETDASSLYRMNIIFQWDHSFLICLKAEALANVTNTNHYVKTISDQSEELPPSSIYARTFGHFDLFCNDNPILFSNAKEKELLALLIDRRGGAITSAEAIAILWPDRPVDDALKSKYRKLCMTLSRTLGKYNISHILISHYGTRNINTSAFICDYYELLNNNEAYKKTFHNTYMIDYSWAEETLASLWDYS